MQNISNIDKAERVQLSYLFVIGLIILSLFSITVMGIKGLILSLLALAGVILLPFIYKRPTLFLCTALFVYPLTRFMSLDDKFVTTGLLYALSLPSALWVMSKYYAKISKSSYYLWAMVAYIAVILLNFIRLSPDMIGLVKEAGRTFYGIFIVIAVYNYVQNIPEKIKKLSYGISYLLNFVAMVALVQYILKFGGYYVEGFFRVRGTFTNFNEYGFVISIFICFALYNLLSSHTNKQRLYWSGSILLNLMALVLTLSKASLAMTAFIIVALGLTLPMKRKIQLFGASTVISIFISGFMLATGVLQNMIVRFSDNTSLDWRYDMWHRLYAMIIQGNVFLGQGAGASREFLKLLLPTGESNAPHNIYLETTYNFGVIGLLPFIFIFVFLLVQGISIFGGNSLSNNQNKLIGISVMLITIVAMVQNFVSNAFYDRAVSIIFWAILTLLICWYNYYRSIVNKSDK